MTEKNWDDIRKKFPVTQNYTYLNTASSGAIARETADAVAAFYQDQLHHAAINRSQWLDAIKSARKRAADLLHTSSDHVGFTTDVSAAMNFVADRINEGKKIILFEGDFPSVKIPWIARGFDILWISKERDQSVSMEKIAEAIRKGGDVVSISWVQYSSGFAIDLKTLAELCMLNNVTLIVDGTQGLGAIPMNVDISEIDVLIASSFKWQGAGYGICIYYENPDSAFDYPVKLTGWNSLVRFSGDMVPDNLRTNAPAIEAGHAKYANLIALDKGLEIMSEIGWQNIYRRNKDLSNYLMARLTENNVKLHSSFEENFRSSIICIKAGKDLFDQLDSAHIKTTRREDYIRLSLHYYNSFSDIDQAVEIISQQSK